MDTRHYGWPIAVPVKFVGSKVFIEARKGLTPYGYFNEKQCKRGAFKQLEEFLKHYGLQDTDIYIDKNSRDFISAEAFILTLIAGVKLRDPTRNQIQFAWTQLCMFLATIIVKATFGKENSDVGNSVMATSIHLPNIEANATASSASQAFHGCIKAADSTSTMVERVLSGQISRSTQLEGRIKEQEKAFSTIAKTVHHGSKVCK